MVYNSILITGANRGLGLDFVRHCLKLSPPPKHIFAVCRAPDKADELKKLAAANPSVHLIGIEITDPTQHDKAVREVKKFVGSAGLNLLINNAGIFDWATNSLEKTTRESLMAHYELNLVAPVLLMKAFYPLLKEAAAQGKGDIKASVVLNITAGLGSIVYADRVPGPYPYKYSKAALNMATYSLAKDMQPSGVFVTSLHPGHVRTDMGGPTGQLSPEESVSGCLNVITHLEEKHRGKMYSWNNEEMSY